MYEVYVLIKKKFYAPFLGIFEIGIEFSYW